VAGRERMKTRQSGITLIGFLIMLLVLGFFAFMGMKLVPSYIEFFGVKKAMTQMASDGSSGDLNDIRRNLIYKMGFQYVDDATIKPQDITIDRRNNASVLEVSYDKRIHFLYNIDFLLHFENAVPMRNVQS
jgi:Tfp pilus assembly major pilin PilA